MKMSVNERIICAGFGGQGIMLIGKLLAQTGMSEGYNVTWLPSYGAEVRGGTAHSMIRISTGTIASPIITGATSCIIMNKLSMQKFMKRIVNGGLAILNSSMIDAIPKTGNVKIVSIPLTKYASDLGNIKIANMIALGAFAKIKGIISLKSIISNLDRVLPSKKELTTINKKALECGYALAQKEK